MDHNCPGDFIQLNYRYQPTCQILPAVLDKLYTDAFGPAKRDGTFVEVGAHDGWHWSNTWGLANMGWRGVFVEPVPELFEACRLTHRNHNAVFVHGAIGDCDGVATLGMGAYGAERGSPEQPFTIEQFALNTLLSRIPAVQPGFELLVIDVEGGEQAVLDGFDVALWRPKMVIIERPPVPNKFLDTGYRMVHTDWINTIYVRPEIVS
jgi:FkbM family methyltransferase